jgi:hypothetical protein
MFQMYTLPPPSPYLTKIKIQFEYRQTKVENQNNFYLCLLDTRYRPEAYVNKSNRDSKY